MAENWVNNLDMCAQNGILNYDAAAFIKGQAPRYVGNPTENVPPFPELSETPILAQPQTDEFKHEVDKIKEDTTLVKLPTWKKAAFSLLAIGCLAFAGYKCKSVYQWIKGKFQKPPVNS